jgi:hypothetical protein
MELLPAGANTVPARINLLPNIDYLERERALGVFYQGHATAGRDARDTWSIAVFGKVRTRLRPEKGNSR